MNKFWIEDESLFAAAVDQMIQAGVDFIRISWQCSHGNAVTSDHECSSIEWLAEASWSTGAARFKHRRMLEAVVELSKSVPHLKGG